MIGRPREAQAYAESALALAAQTSLSSAISAAHVLAAWTFLLLGDVERVLSLVNADAIVAADPPMPLWTATSAVMTGWAWVRQGQLERGIAEVEVGYRSCLENQGEPSTFDYQYLRAEAYQIAGRLDEAAALSDEALGVYRRYGQGYFAVELYRVRGELHWAVGTDRSRREAMELWQEGLRLARERGALSCELRIALAMARAAGESEDAQAHRERVRQLLSEFDATERSPDLDIARQLGR